MMAAWPIVSTILGWLYFSAWSISFYPQFILNYRRKSVEGLSLDFVVLNVVGFLCYVIYTISFLSSSTIDDEYRQRHPGSTSSSVRVNDAVFAVHALVLSLATLSQAYLFGYKRATNQRISIPTIVFCGFSAAIIAVLSLLAETDKLQWIDILYLLSYIKLFISLCKYLPQLWLNYKRQSTEGWSILNILLDFTGGSLSLLRKLFEEVFVLY